MEDLKIRIANCFGESDGIFGSHPGFEGLSLEALIIDFRSSGGERSDLELDFRQFQIDEGYTKDTIESNMKRIRSNLDELWPQNK